MRRRDFSALLVAGGAVRAYGQGNPIRVGLSAGITGPIAETVKSYLAGITVAIDRVNKEGGVAGRQVALDIADDQYSGDRAAANTEQFLQRGNEVLMGYAGTGTVARALDVLRDKECLLFGPYTGATQLRAKAGNKAVFLMADYQAEVMRLIEHFGTVGASRFALMYQADGFGTPLFDFAKEVLAQRRLSLVSSVALQPGAAPSKQEVSAVVAAAPHATMLFTVAGPTTKAVTALRQSFRGSIGLLSFLSNRAFIQALGSSASGVVISQTVPGPWDLNHPLIRELRLQEARSEIQDFTHAHVVGYLTGRLFVQTLKETRGRTQPTALLEAWQAVKTRSPFGLHFGATGATYTDIAMLQADGRFVH